MTSKTAAATAEREEQREHARTNLVRFVRPGMAVYATVVHRSASGMSRVVRIYVVSGQEIINISGQAAEAIAYAWDRDRGGIIIRGCGFDVRDDIVRTLSRALYGQDGDLTMRSL